MLDPQQIENLARHSILTDLKDKVGLVSMQEEFDNLKTTGSDEELQEVVDASSAASEWLGGLVLEEYENPDEVFGWITDCIQYVQTIQSALDASGGEGHKTPIPACLRPPGTAESDLPTETPVLDEEDVELFNAWLDDCGARFDELEVSILATDEGVNCTELVALIRREIHTLKAEFGVFGLTTGQQLCHNAETGIDRCVDQGMAIPIDPLLSLVDWCKTYIGGLSESLQTTPPNPQLLSEQIDQLGHLATPAESPSDEVTATYPEQTEPTLDAAHQGKKSNEQTSKPSPAKLADSIVSAAGIREQEKSTEDSAKSEDQCYLDETPISFGDDVVFDDTLRDFIHEAAEHFASAEQALLELEYRSSDIELINTVFRAFHTIKGVASFMNLAPIVELAHLAESLLDDARSGKIELDSKDLGLILEALDLLNELVSALDGAPAPQSGMYNYIKEQLRRTVAGEQCLRAPTRPGDVAIPPVIGELLVSMGMASEAAVNQAIESKKAGSDVLATLLTENGIVDVDTFERELLSESELGNMLRANIINTGIVDQNVLDEAISSRRHSDKRIGELLGLTTEDMAPALRQQRRLRLEAEISRAMFESERESEEQAATSRLEPEPDAATPNSEPSFVAQNPMNADKSRSRASMGAAQTVKVNMARMDNLITMVGELVIAQQMVVQDQSVQEIKEQKTKRNVGHVGKIIRDLQEVAMSLRMVTVKSTFQKMTRLVRDLASKSGKQIRLETDGEETELDRSIVDQIHDPLVHMIRNSCDHGLEKPEDRKKAGKPEYGVLTLRAYHQGGSIVIEIADDGQGLNRDRILARAVERGLIDDDRNLEEVPDAEAYNLIFKPGFSTAEKITDVSGRGVGMDVVRRNIEELRGKVEIQSTVGKGSTFLLRLPLTMAIIDGMIVRVGSNRYVIPTLSIEQSFRPTPEQISTVIGRGELAEVRGSLLPVFRLKTVFSISEGEEQFDESLLIVLECNEGSCCLMVDEIIGQQQVVIKSLGRGIRKIRGISGGAILGDGRIAPIIDADGLVKEATEIEPGRLGSGFGNLAPPGFNDPSSMEVADELNVGQGSETDEDHASYDNESTTEANATSTT